MKPILISEQLPGLCLHICWSLRLSRSGCPRCRPTVHSVISQLSLQIVPLKRTELECSHSNTRSNRGLIDQPRSSHPPGLRWMDLGSSVPAAGQTLLYLPPYGHFLQRCLCSNVRVNELAGLCSRMCSLGSPPCL